MAIAKLSIDLEARLAGLQAGLDKARQDLGKDRPGRNGGRRFDRGAFVSSSSPSA